jgi:hypothetical protein
MLTRKISMILVDSDDTSVHAKEVSGLVVTGRDDDGGGRVPGSTLVVVHYLSIVWISVGDEIRGMI